MKIIYILLPILLIAGCAKPLTPAFSTSESRQGVSTETSQPSKSAPLAARPVTGPEFGDVYLD